jgi:G:T/U-mismatch repair DNA glycosylase/Sec-independent protein translocase protein TatA
MSFDFFKQFAYNPEDGKEKDSTQCNSIKVSSAYPPSLQGKTSSVSSKHQSLEVISLLESEEDENIPEISIVEKPIPKETEVKAPTKPSLTPIIRKPAGLGELYKSPNQKENILKLIIVGHNPSEQSFTKGHYYANPVNRMWPLLRKATIVPSNFTCENDRECPSKLRIGFTDVCWNYCETNSFNITDKELSLNKDSFYGRLGAHCQRVHQNYPNILLEECYPRILAFAGVRQWKALFPNNHFIQKINIGGLSRGRKKALSDRKEEEEDEEKEAEGNQVEGDGEEETSRRKKQKTTTTTQKESSGIQKNTMASFLQLSSSYSGTASILSSSVVNPPMEMEYGVQTVKPPDWPQLLEKTIVFLLPSPSGAAALTNEQRETPYNNLGLLLQTIVLPDELLT